VAGLLGFLSEASEIQQELGVSFNEALAIQRQRSDERMYESNVIYVNFRRGTHGLD
jgi:hypothetical protein